MQVQVPPDNPSREYTYIKPLSKSELDSNISLNFLNTKLKVHDKVNVIIKDSSGPYVLASPVNNPSARFILNKTLFEDHFVPNDTSDSGVGSSLGGRIRRKSTRRKTYKKYKKRYSRKYKK